MKRERAEILAGLGEILSEMHLVEDAGILREDTGLLGKGLGLDSVEALQVVAAIEERFDLTVDDDLLQREHFRTVGTLMALIEGLVTP